MKKISLVLGVAFLSGCTMGINQSVATINNRPYLVEKKTYTLPIPIYQWSGKTEITPLQITEENKNVAKQMLQNAKDKCFGKNNILDYRECLTKYFNEDNN